MRRDKGEQARASSRREEGRWRGPRHHRKCFRNCMLSLKALASQSECSHVALPCSTAANFVHPLAAMNPTPLGGTAPRHQRKRCPARPPARPRCHRRVSRRTQHPHTAASAAARAAFQGSCPPHAPGSRSSGTCACRTAGARRQTAALMLMLLLMHGRGWPCALHAVVRLLHGSLDEVHGDTLVPCVAGSARCATLAPAPRRSWRTDVPVSWVDCS